MKINHWGDCSIYKLGCYICDCGELRKTASEGKVPDEIWEAWGKHLSQLKMFEDIYLMLREQKE